MKQNLDIDKTDMNLYKSNGVLKPTAADPIRSKEDIRKMEECLLTNNKYRDYLLFIFGISTGLRPHELLAVTMGMVYHHDATVKDYFVVQSNRTKENYKVYLNDKCKEALEKYAENIGHAYTDDPLFISRQRDIDGNYKSISIPQLNRILKNAAKKCEIKDHISSNSLRKTFIYHAVNSSETDIGALLCIDNALSVYKIYQYLEIDDEEITQFIAETGEAIL